MKFKSRVDLLHKIIISATIFLMLGIVILIWSDNSESIAVNIFSTIICLATSALLISIYTNTNYRLDSEFLHYQTGPVKGKFPVSRIKELDVNRTLWVGVLKPATALNGLIIKYNKCDKIYISPENNEGFVSELIKLNPNIKINRFK